MLESRHKMSFFTYKNTAERSTGPHKSSFSLYKQVNVKSGDHE